MTSEDRNESRAPTTVSFHDDEYESSTVPRTLDIGCDTRFVRFALWSGDDIELCLTSSTAKTMTYAMASHLLNKYQLGLTFVVVEYVQGDGPTCWTVRLDAEKLSEEEVVTRVRQILLEHNATIARLRREFYSPKRAD